MTLPPAALVAKSSAISAVSACLLVCSPVDLEAAEAAFFSAGAGDGGGATGVVAAIVTAAQVVTGDCATGDTG